MTCYVDTVREYPEAGLRFAAYCHLLADDRDELHAFAAGLGMPRRAFQDHAWRWHYDLPAEFRPAALAAGARAVDFHAVALLLRARRASLSEGATT